MAGDGTNLKWACVKRTKARVMYVLGDVRGDRVFDVIGVVTQSAGEDRWDWGAKAPDGEISTGAEPGQKLAMAAAERIALPIQPIPHVS